MDVRGILAYTGWSPRFAAVMGGVWVIGRAIWQLTHRAKVSRRRELVLLAAVIYFSALVEIIALRGGVKTGRLLRLRPFETTLDGFRRGLWNGIYHALGNLVWFLPEGVLLSCFFSAGKVVSGAAFRSAGGRSISSENGRDGRR